MAFSKPLGRVRAWLLGLLDDSEGTFGGHHVAGVLVEVLRLSSDSGAK